MAEDVMLNEAIQAVRQGQRARARDLLTRLLRADQSNPEYWLWMSAVVDTLKERAYCLQTAQRLNPADRRARRGLVLIGAATPDQHVVPQPPVRRKWQVDVLQEPPTGIRALWSRPVVRLAVFGVLGLIVIGLILAGIFSANRPPAAVAARPTKTPGPPPTFTLTPTALGGKPTPQVSPSPTYVGPKPLWMLLEATYTPTPLYVNTPHPISEAYRAGQRAFERGDLTTALNFFVQASQVEPNAPDIPYYIGEIERALGKFESALEYYNHALELNPNFAPAYLGRARASMALDPKADVAQDLQAAIKQDPGLGEAYLEWAAYLLARQDAETALQAIEAAGQVLPDSPLILLYRARLALLQGENEQALELAQQANQRDRTLLPAYLTLGAAALANQDFMQAREALELYVDYAPEDAQGWLELGRAHARLSQPDQAFLEFFETPDEQQVQAALRAFNRAVELDQKNPDLYFYRGLLYLATGEGQKAVNDLFRARKLDVKSFAINLAMGRALLVAGRIRDGYAQIDGCENLAADERELAAVYYWRALAGEKLRLDAKVVADWKALLAMPEDALPAGWAETARQHLSDLTSTPTPKPSPTAKPSATATSTRTPAPEPTYTSSNP